MTQLRTEFTTCCSGMVILSMGKIKTYNKMKKTSGLFMVLVGTIMFSSCGDGSSDSKKQADSANTANIDSAKLRDTTSEPVHMADLKQDAEFAVAAADGGMLEVALGKLAVKKGVSQAVKKLGAQMVTDHSKANMELKALAIEKHIVLPDEMSNKCQKQVSDLDEKKGKDFDKAYADLMVTDHKGDIDEFKKESEKGNDAQVSGWAKDKIPLLEHHLMMAEETQKKLEK
jgi:putative membrane protein